MKNKFNNSGFTLVELMVAMVVAIIISAAVYSVYIVQQKHTLDQEQVVEMQQNLRAAMTVMEREIRMAGFDPTGKAGAGITTAMSGQIGFTMDIDDGATPPGPSDGDTNDPNEQIDYGFLLADDANRDGVPDVAGQALSLGRQVGGGYQPIADNIERVEFNYLDGAGNSADANADGVIDNAEMANIRSVQVSILARAGRKDRRFNNTMTYTSAGGQTWGPYNDNYRRRLAVSEIKIRNL